MQPDLRDIFGARILEVLAKRRLRQVARVDREGSTWADFSNGKLGVELANSSRDADSTRMFVMEPAHMGVQKPFTLVVAYIRGDADPVVESLDALAAFFDENYPRIERLFSGRDGRDRSGYEEYVRQWHLRRFGLDLGKGQP